MLNNKRFRSQEKVHLIREENVNGKTITVDAWMPVGNGWNQGTAGALDWINLGCGWRAYDEYMATKHSAEVAAKRETVKEKK